MLDSLRIEGFRAFDRLEIPRLGRVNLLVGQNSVGKSTVLEAVRLWASGLMAFEEIERLLTERQEFQARDPLDFVDVTAWERLFHGEANVRVASRLAISSGNVPPELLEVSLQSGQRTTTSEGEKWRLITVDGEPDVTASRLLVIDTMGRRRIEVLKAPDSAFFRSDTRSSLLRVERCITLPARGWSMRTSDKLWQAVDLTDDQHHVIDALRLIDLSVEGLTFIDVKLSWQELGDETHRVTRVAQIKRRGRPREPLKSLGDGIERLLHIILALVNARGGFLLLDEVENGIHYRVLPRLWHLIFKVAADLDVQVFAATHSWDCITAFQQAAADHPAEGVLVKLEKDENGARAKVFDEADLAVITQADIEVR